MKAAARAVVGGIATNQRTRQVVRRPKVKQRRQYRGTLCLGTLSCGRGAWLVSIDAEGNPTAPAWDASLRLIANIGDSLLVCGTDVAAVRITGVDARGFTESWRVETVYGDCADGAVIVMKGPKQ